MEELKVLETAPLQDDPIKILAVDDRPENLVVLDAVLGTAEYCVLKASSGYEAVQLVEKNADIAVILMDVMVPVMDGFRTAEIIRKMQRAQDIPILLITAIQQDQRYVYQAYEEGAV